MLHMYKDGVNTGKGSSSSADYADGEGSKPPSEYARRPGLFHHPHPHHHCHDRCHDHHHNSHYKTHLSSIYILCPLANVLIVVYFYFLFLFNNFFDNHENFKRQGRTTAATDSSDLRDVAYKQVGGHPHNDDDGDG